MEEVVAETELCTEVHFNNLEMSYAEDVALAGSLKPNKILVIENFRKKGRSKMDSKAIDENKAMVAFWKSKYPQAKIEHFFQFKKGMRKNSLQIAAVKEVQNVSDFYCIYEKSPAQSIQEFETDLQLPPKVSSRIVLEAESNDIAGKISLSLKRGIRDFTIVGGKYNLSFWTDNIITPIHTTDGKVTIAFTRRMNSSTKESYLKFAMKIGADYAFHGSPGGWPEDNNEPLFLDSDMVYKPISVIKDQQIKVSFKNCQKDKRYYLSRFLAIEKANEISKTTKLSILIEQIDPNTFF